MSPRNIPEQWTAQQLKAYHEGTLSEKERQAMEADALEDPFLSDALEGAEHLDMAEAQEQLEQRWYDREKGVKGGRSHWKLLAYFFAALVTVGMLYKVWSSQHELAVMSETLSQEREANEALVYTFQDSLMLLEISLAQEIPVQERLDADQVIHDRPTDPKTGDESADPDIKADRRDMDTMPSRSVAEGQGQMKGPKLKVKEFPVIYRLDFKLADHPEDYVDVEFILPGFLTGTPASLAEKKKGVQEERGTVTYTALLDKALKAYKEDDFKNSLVMLDRILEKYPRDENATFYSALCYYNLGKWEKASSLFRIAQLHENRVFEEEAEFYRALSLWKAGLEEESQRILRSIVDRQSFYAKRAQDHLKMTIYKEEH